MNSEMAKSSCVFMSTLLRIVAP